MARDTTAGALTASDSRAVPHPAVEATVLPDAVPGERHSGAVELIPAILLFVGGDDIPEGPQGHDGAAWDAWRAQYRAALELSEDDVPDGVHVALRCIHTARLLDAVIDRADEWAAEDPSPSAAARFSTARFRTAVDQALTDRELFASRLERRLLERSHPKPTETARTIAGYR